MALMLHRADISCEDPLKLTLSCYIDALRYELQATVAIDRLEAKVVCP